MWTTAMPEADDAKLGADVQVHALRQGARRQDAQPAEAGARGHVRAAVGEEATQIGTASRCGRRTFRPVLQAARHLPCEGAGLETLHLLARLRGGNRHSRDVNGLPVCVPVGTQMPHGAGIAFAQKYRKKDAAVVVTSATGAHQRATSTRPSTSRVSSRSRWSR